ncbi:unnamed protein product [Gongylonema pulchrum]|uniref:Uncharacterized protein n=1 Tax=Gongylonema pulchrum TaxID=637853 RepID=A0A183DUZ1_9BILA|nr:unnamed protein product [Gongylonema pulchrum]
MQMMIMLLPNIVERIDNCDTVLDFGAGPTIHVSAESQQREYFSKNLCASHLRTELHFKIVEFKGMQTYFN